MSKKEIKFFDDNGKKFFLLVSIIVLSCSIIHGKESIIRNGCVEGNVAGNGSGVNGTGPFNQDPNNNKIRILGNASVRGDVFGARNDSDDRVDVTNNEAIIDTTGNIAMFGRRISNGNITGDVYGGWSLGNGKAISNKVVISNGNISLSVIGGRSDNREATGNVVEINGGNIGESLMGGWSLAQAEEAEEEEDIGQSLMGGWSLGTATSNKVVISNGNISLSVIGGGSDNREAKENVVEIKGGTIEQWVEGGRSSRTSTNNKVVISNGEIKGYVYGGVSIINGETKGNEVKIIGGSIGQWVYGGNSNGNSTSNKVVISNGNITRYVYGGYSENGEAKENIVEINGGTIGQWVEGGRSSRTSISNKVVISNGEIKRCVLGGWSENGEAKENVVEINGGTIEQGVEGGWSSRTSTNNKVLISNGEIKGQVLGGESQNEEAAWNVVEIKGGSIEQRVFGGYSSNGEVIGNVVQITGGTIRHDVFGGWSENGLAAGNVVQITRGTIGQGVYGGRSVRGTATSNKVTISDGEIRGNVYGGWSENGETERNEVEINGGNIGESVFGGESRGNGKAINNKVVITNGVIRKEVCGARSLGAAISNKVVIISSGEMRGNVYGGYSVKGEATGNEIVISSGNIIGKVYGGYSVKGEATGNEIVISSGNIIGKVYGGYSVAGEAKGNEVEIAGSPTFSSTNTIIYGGWSENGRESKRGNVLKIKAKGIEVLGIENFEEYKFYNPKKGTPMVIVGSVVDLSGVKVSIEELDIRETLSVGNKYLLIKSSSRIRGIRNVKIMSTQTILARYDYADELAVGLGEDNELRVMVRNIEVNTKSKELTEARVGSMIFVGEGISREIEKEIQGEKGNRKVKPFVVVREGKSKYGNEIKEVGGVRVGGGIVKEIEKFGREMVLGAYVEYGDGKYRSKEEIGGEVNSRGKSNYVGIGLKGEVEIKEGIYGQIGIRIGKYDSDFESEDMGIGSKEGEEMKYDIEGMYAGVEVGGRYKVVEKEKIGVEVKGEIGIMSMGGKEVKLTSGNKVDFKGVKIGKVRMEVRGEYEVKEKVKPYVGLGCEYEKMWEVEARSGNLEIPSSHIEGISGIGDMGVEVEIGKIGIRCGCECYVGERKGIDGMLKVKYTI